MLLLQGLLGNAFNQSCSVLSVHIIINSPLPYLRVLKLFIVLFVMNTPLCGKGELAVF